MSRELTLIPDPEETELGPAMAACTPLERRFVIAMCETGGQDYTRAATMAGSKSSTPESMRVAGHTLAKRNRVREALKEEATKRLNEFGLLGVQTLIDLCRAGMDEKVRLKAATSILDRTGFSIIQKMEVTHKDISKTDDALIQRMKELCSKNPEYLRLVPAPLLPAVQAAIGAIPAPIIEIEAEEVRYATTDQAPDDIDRDDPDYHIIYGGRDEEATASHEEQT